jgi:four helix bundle protein
MKDNIIVNKSFHFAVKIIRLYQGLIKDKKEFILSKQILRCGCSIGANVEEALGGFSRKDFIAKMNIAYNEARETRYWLRLLKETNYIDTMQFQPLINNCEEILKILFQIINSSRKN